MRPVTSNTLLFGGTLLIVGMQTVMSQEALTQSIAPFGNCSYPGANFSGVCCQHYEVGSPDNGCIGGHQEVCYAGCEPGLPSRTWVDDNDNPFNSTGGSYTDACDLCNYGVCCVNAENCSLQFGFNCIALPNAVFYPDATDCSDFECKAWCCMVEGCEFMTQSECDMHGGIWVTTDLVSNPEHCPADVCFSNSVAFVPTEHETVNDAITAVGENGIIYVEVGTYNEFILLPEFNITIVGTPDSFGNNGTILLGIKSSESATSQTTSIISNIAFEGSENSQGNNYIKNQRIVFTNCDFQYSYNLSDYPENFNPLKGYGGGLTLDAADCVLSGCLFKDNQCDLGGGGLYATLSIVDIVNSEFINNSVVSDSGGGLSMSQSNITMMNCTVSQNQSETVGGGMYLDSFQSSAFKHCTFESNQSKTDGGGLYCDNSQNYTLCDVTISNCNFNSNNADEFGGGLYVHDIPSTYTFSVQNSTFDGNTGHEGGGGLYSKDSDFNLKNTTIKNNSTRVTGGGMYSNNCTTHIDGCTFSKNELSLGKTMAGGGLYKDTESNMTLIDSVFDANFLESVVETANGLGLYVQGGQQPGSIEISGCTFSNHGTGDNGGGIYVEDGYSGLPISHTSFTSNSVVGNGSCIYFKSGTTLIIDNCTVSANQSGEAGLIYCDGSSDPEYSLTNSIVCGNLDGQGVGKYYGAFNNTFSEVCTFDDGGCCTLYGCSMMTSDECEAIEGTFYGVGVDCSGCSVCVEDLTQDGKVEIEDLLQFLHLWGACP